MNYDDLDDLPTAYTWFEEGENQPVSYDGEFLWKTRDDAYEMMKEYMKDEGLTDISEYQLREVAVTRVQDAESFMGFSDSAEKTLEP